MALITHLSVAIPVYVALLAIFALWRPPLMFDVAGKPKRWGASISETESPFAPAFILPFLALLVYVFVSLGLVVWHPQKGI